MMEPYQSTGGYYPKSKNIYYTDHKDRENFFRALKKDNTVTEFLSIWHLNEYECSSLYEALGTNKTLTCLTFYTCSIDMDSVVRSIKKNSKIENLCFNQCDLLWSDIYSLVNFLCENTTIRDVSIYDRDVRTGFADQFERLLVHNRGIRCLNLFYNDLIFCSKDTWKYLYAYPKDINKSALIFVERSIEENFHTNQLYTYRTFMNDDLVNCFMNYILTYDPCYVYSLFVLNCNDEKKLKHNNNHIFRHFFSSEYFDIHLLFMVFEFATLRKTLN